MDTGLNYNDANSTDNFVRYFRATTQVLRDLGMGSVYWPGIGGKITAGQSDDWYAMQKLHGSGTNLTLTTPNASGAGRLRYAWGLTGGTPTAPTTPTTPPTTPSATPSTVRNVGTNTCLYAPVSPPGNAHARWATVPPRPRSGGH